MHYYPVLKRNELSNHEGTRRSLTCTLLSERNQSEKTSCCVIPSVQHYVKLKSMETVKYKWQQEVGEKGEIRDHRGFLDYIEYFIWYIIGGYLLHICQNT